MNSDQRRPIVNLFAPGFKHDFPDEKLGVADRYWLRRFIADSIEEFSSRTRNYMLGAFYVSVLKSMKNLGYSPDINRRLKSEFPNMPTLAEFDLRRRLNGD